LNLFAGQPNTRTRVEQLGAFLVDISPDELVSLRAP
jgi:hypothetical protein